MQVDELKMQKKFDENLKQSTQKYGKMNDNVKIW